ncbi:NAD(P)-binding protein [Hyaloscypha variabilis F]|uniref:NAD(P)-binding protein n=1 Tax=Hyaloscypha variabilis (strain UAMH 11265 / GT02V1 / F) TaxID=1149755 RepID=A0A2J6QW26_HYAVF|nr:NAD(P)-binding protein [Hyaloscypha variabilis F]
MATPAATTVLVTGGSGFIGSHIILQLLAAGYTVRTTVRSLKREAEVRQTLKDAGAVGDDRLSFFAADLTKDEGWSEAVAGCTYVLHVASPFPLALPKHEDDLIIPAREGALRVLRASKDAGVKRVVLTSSFAAVGYGHPARETPFTEEDWSILDGKVPVPPYQKSKTIAEKAAWDWIKSDGGSLELVVVNPVGVFGPVLGKDYSTSIEIVKKALDGSVPGCPKVSLGAVDVRDIADLEIRAMTDPAAKGERFIGTNDGASVSILDIAKILRKARPDQSKKAPTRELPNWLVHAVAFFDSSIRQILPELGHAPQISNEKAKRVLGWKPRSTEDGIVATADSLFQHKIL